MIPDHVLQAAKTLVQREPVQDIPAAVKTLREYKNLSQEEFAHKCHVQRTAIGNWETGFRLPTTGRTASILRAVDLSDQFDALTATRGDRQKLDREAYRNKDADSVEYDFFLRTRGEVLERIHAFAITGNTQAGRLYLDWMNRNEARIAARISSVVTVSGDAETLRNRALDMTKGQRRITNSAEPRPQQVVGDISVSDTSEKPNVVSPSDSSDT